MRSKVPKTEPIVCTNMYHSSTGLRNSNSDARTHARRAQATHVAELSAMREKVSPRRAEEKTCEPSFKRQQRRKTEKQNQFEG